VQAVGVSNYGPQQLQRIHRSGTCTQMHVLDAAFWCSLVVHTAQYGVPPHSESLLLRIRFSSSFNVLCIRYLQQQGVPLSSAQVSFPPPGRHDVQNCAFRKQLLSHLHCSALVPVPGVPCLLPQVQFSLLSKGPEQLETLAVCRDLGITVIAYSPLGLGASWQRKQDTGILPCMGCDHL
jgi:hypothetical protein